MATRIAFAAGVGTLYGAETEMLNFVKLVVQESASMEQLTTYSVDERMFNELFQ